jgi:hypothetical protein
MFVWSCRRSGWGRIYRSIYSRALPRSARQAWRGCAARAAVDLLCHTSPSASIDHAAPGHSGSAGRGPAPTLAARYDSICFAALASPLALAGRCGAGAGGHRSCCTESRALGWRGPAGDTSLAPAVRFCSAVWRCRWRRRSSIALRPPASARLARSGGDASLALAARFTPPRGVAARAGGHLSRCAGP